jgi:ribosomal protein S18 acetylase RimI-like enzyme
MATAALTNPEARIVSLADADLHGLEDLFDEQCAEWLSLLGWDYSGASRLVREVARRRELAGVAAVSGDTTVGFAFYVAEGTRCSIGDIYVSNHWRGLGIDRQMAVGILHAIEQLPRQRRIESQCVSIDNQAATDVFLIRGFDRFDRAFMKADVKSPAGEVKTASSGRRKGKAPDIELRAWEEDDFSRAVRVIHRSHREEHDSRINSQYRTEEGCAELLSILTDSIWCGSFMRRVSQVAIDRETGKQLGILIASRISSRTGHLGQISVLPRYQGLGIGRRLIGAALSAFRDLGFDSVTLAVTTANVGAVHLYRSCGFHTIHEFPVFFSERR